MAERDRGVDAQRAAEAHIDRLAEFEDAASMGDADYEDAPDAAGPYCGCNTCDVREAIAAAWPHALAYAADLVAREGLGRTITALHRLLMDEARKSTLAGLEPPA